MGRRRAAREGTNGDGEDGEEEEEGEDSVASVGSVENGDGDGGEGLPLATAVPTGRWMILAIVRRLETVGMGTMTARVYLGTLQLIAQWW